MKGWLLAAPVALVLVFAQPPWHVRLVIDDASAAPWAPFEAFDAASLNVADIDGDGRPEIVSANDNNRVYVFDLASGKLRAQIETEHPPDWAAREINPVAIAPLGPDGAVCLVIPNSAAHLAAWCYRGRTPLGDFVFARLWDVHVDAAAFDADFRKEHPWIWSDGDPSNDIPGLDGNAFVADVDGDGRPEIFTETDGYPGQFSFDADGDLRWMNTAWDGNAGVVVSDLDGDGKKEAVFASDSGVVTAYDAASGKIRWTFDAKKAGASPGSITVAPSVGDLDGDGKRELVFAARNVATGDGWQERSHAVWFALRSDGSVLWRASEAWMNPLAYTRPALVDANGDGKLDVVAMDWNTVGHKPGSWEPTERGPQLFALRGTTGKPLWHVSVAARWSNKDVVVADVHPEPGLEVVASAARGDRDGLGIYALSDGRELDWHALPTGWEAMRGPVAALLDGRIQLVVPLGRPDPAPNYRELDVGHRTGAIAVIDTGSTGEISWSANHVHAD